MNYTKKDIVRSISINCRGLLGINAKLCKTDFEINSFIDNLLLWLSDCPDALKYLIGDNLFNELNKIYNTHKL